MYFLWLSSLLICVLVIYRSVHIYSTTMGIKFKIYGYWIRSKFMGHQIYLSEGQNFSRGSTVPSDVVGKLCRRESKL